MKLHDQSEHTVKDNGLRAALLIIGGIVILGLIAMAIYGTGKDSNPLLEPEADKTLETPADRPQ